ncbi:juvenile hormone acid O-methyltransferase-like [Amblyomma americanum]
MSVSTENVPTAPKKSENSSCYIDPSSLKNAKKPGYQHKLDALQRVHFVRPTGAGQQHLDVGCGSGGFTRDALLDHLHPCRRIVAVDRSDLLLDYAREHASHPAIIYDHLDIETDDPQPLLDKYGQFDRIYSFLALQCVRDLERAYRNMFRLLKDGGECALVTLTGSVITDVMYQLSCMKQWKAYVPDPTKIYSDRFFFEPPIVGEEVVKAEKNALEEAGLTLVSCSVYDSQWKMSDVESWIDLYAPVFKLDANIPEKQRDAFRTDCRSLLAKNTITTDDGCSMRHSFVVVHAQRPPRD